MAPQSVLVKVLFFAKAREVLGKSSSMIEIPQKVKGQDIRQILEAEFPNLSVLGQSYVLALNEEYLNPEDVLDITSKDELGVIPPLSGG